MVRIFVKWASGLELDSIQAMADFLQNIQIWSVCVNFNSTAMRQQQHCWCFS